MSLGLFCLLMALMAYGQYAKSPKRVIHWQPREVPAQRRRPSPWARPEPAIPAVVPQWTDLTEALHQIRPASVPVGTIPATPPAAPVVTQAPIAAKPQRAKASVVVTVSTRIRLDALAALRRLGFSQKDAQAQLDTTLGLAIQQSLKG
jgi:hypothetical protein